MDWDRYKALCDEGDVLSRAMLERTAGILDDSEAPELARRLRRLCETEPLPKPADHRGGARSDFFRLDLAPWEVAGILRAIEAADVQARSNRVAGKPSGFVVAWRECLDWLTGRHPRSPHPRDDAVPR